MLSRHVLGIGRLLLYRVVRLILYRTLIEEASDMRRGTHPIDGHAHRCNSGRRDVGGLAAGPTIPNRHVSGRARGLFHAALLSVVKGHSAFVTLSMCTRKWRCLSVGQCYDGSLLGCDLRFWRMRLRELHA